jgi:peptidoglycan/LPS O-acetylase OafA/YrhL
LLVCSFPALLAVAVLSWHFIEHPALRLTARAGDSVVLGRSAVPESAQKEPGLRSTSRAPVS